MAVNQKKFYVTTPIYYGSGKPHLGSLYTTVLADVCARWHQLLGQDTFFLTGTDEHGQKIAEGAKKAGKEPKAFVDTFVQEYQQTWAAYNIKYTKFIRTTDPEHKKAVAYFIQTLKKNGDIYKGSYSGWYCTPCETFVPSKQEANDIGPMCPSCGRPTVFVSEECYFFRLSAYQERLLKFFKENSDFIAPRERLNEVLVFVESGLKDLSISRTTVKWGIPFPDDPEQVVYVWADALTNYISGVGYGDPGRAAEFAHWWPADVHIMGKDIVRFHAVYWIAFLMAANLPLPHKLLVHGYITVDGRKMSKSFGNVVDPLQLHELYGTDPVRYYLVSRLSVAQDANFSFQDLENVITQDLANELGNLLNRIIVLAHKNNCVTLPPREKWSVVSNKLKDAHDALLPVFQEHMANYSFHLAYAEVKRFIGLVNAYVHERQPWVQAGKDQDAFVETVTCVVGSLNTIAHLLWPVMPTAMEQVLAVLGSGQTAIAQAYTASWQQHYMLTATTPLFEKVEGKMKASQSTATDMQIPEISIDDFAQAHLVVGTVMQAHAVEKSEKLIQLTVDCGNYGIRTIVAGVRAYYRPGELIGKQGVFVVNLQPRSVMGIESHGMMLFVPGAEGTWCMIQPSGFAEPGSRLR